MSRAALGNRLKDLRIRFDFDVAKILVHSSHCLAHIALAHFHLERYLLLYGFVTNSRNR